MSNNETKSHPTTETKPQGSGQDSRRILVADDDPAILRLVAAILEKENYAVVTARDGREAYKILQSDQQFTAAIFDVVMPHISGPELVRFMKTENQCWCQRSGTWYPVPGTRYLTTATVFSKTVEQRK